MGICSQLDIIMGGHPPLDSFTVVQLAQLGAADSVRQQRKPRVYPRVGTAMSREPSKTPYPGQEEARRQGPSSPQAGLERRSSSIMGPCELPQHPSPAG